MDIRHYPLRRIASVIGASAALANFALTASAKETFFTPPVASFITNAGEPTLRLRLPGGKVEVAQAVMDAARKKHPDAFLLMETTGDLEIRSTALKLDSRTMLVLSPEAGIVAAADCTATALVTITQAELVSISSSGASPATLDGGGHDVIGISVTGGRRINIDQLKLTHCGKAGVDYQGRDAAAVNEASSVTRCFFQTNGNGLRVTGTAGFMCLDNEFNSQGDVALAIDSLTSVVAGNTFSANQVAIRADSNRGIIARNVFSDQTALELTPKSTGNLVTENRGSAENLTVTIGGSRHQIFRNEIRGSVKLAPEAHEILLLGNNDLTTPAPCTGLQVFNPPTFAHPHQNPVVVPGMKRFDLTVKGGTSAKYLIPVIPVDLAVVVEALQHAREAHPSDVIVLTLIGEFVSRNAEGLKLPPNTCVILDGRILADLGAPLDPLWVREAPLSQLILLPESGFCSFSGGKLDGARQAFFPINANTGSTALIEGVKLTAGARDGFNTKGRNRSSPVFLRQCNVYGNNGRGIWAHVASRIHSIGNVCTGNRMDGIDLDAGSVDGTALFNICTANQRHGVFIEEAVSHQVAFGNILNGNGQAGVHVWNEEVKGNTGQNVVASNQCDSNRRGVSAGGRAADITAHGNLFFNNICRNNRLDGIMAGNSNATGNYFSQSVVDHNNEKDILNPASGIFFNGVFKSEEKPPVPVKNDVSGMDKFLETPLPLWATLSAGVLLGLLVARIFRGK